MFQLKGIYCSWSRITRHINDQKAFSYDSLLSQLVEPANKTHKDHPMLTFCCLHKMSKVCCRCMWVGWKAVQLSLHSGEHRLPKMACKMSRLCGRALTTCRRCSLEHKPTLVSYPITCMALACLQHAPPACPFMCLQFHVPMSV